MGPSLAQKLTVIGITIGPFLNSLGKFKGIQVSIKKSIELRFYYGCFEKNIKI